MRDLTPIKKDLTPANGARHNYFSTATLLLEAEVGIVDEFGALDHC